MLALVRRTFIAAATSMAKVLIIAVMGAGLTKIIDDDGRKVIAKVLTFLLLPMLLFTKVSAAIAATESLSWILVLLYVLIHVGLGFLAAKAVWRFWSWRRRHVISPRFERLPSTDDGEVSDDWILALLVMTLSFPNSGSLPLALADSLCPQVQAIVGDACLHNTVGYISFYFSFLNPIMWLICPRLLAGPPEATIATKEDADEDKPEEEEEEEPEEDVKEEPEENDVVVVKEPRWKSVVGRLRRTPPPVIGAALGVVVGVTGLRDRILATPLGAAAEVVGDAAIPMGIINLGAAIAAAGPKSSTMPPFFVAAVPVLRLVVIPAFSILFTALLHPRDPSLTLVLMLEAAPPPAMQSMVFVQLFATTDLERPLAHILVVSYVASLLTLTTWIAVILTFLGHDDPGHVL